MEQAILIFLLVEVVDTDVGLLLLPGVAKKSEVVRRLYIVCRVGRLRLVKFGLVNILVEVPYYNAVIFVI